MQTYGRQRKGPLAGAFPGSVRLKARQIIGFIAFSHGWTVLFYFLASRLGTSVWEPPAVYLFYTGGAGVMLGGVVMTAVVYGRKGLRDLGSRTIDPRRIRGRWWPVIVLFPAGLTLLSAAVGKIIRPETEAFHTAEAVRAIGSPLVFLQTLLFFLIIGPLPEEIGWRGFLLDRLQVRWSALLSALFIGVLWWMWHIPLFFVPGYFDAFGGPPAGLWGYLLYNIPGSIFAAWIYNNTDRSVLAVILFHFIGNVVGELLAPSEFVRSVQDFVTLPVVVAVVLVFGAKALVRSRNWSG